MKLLELHLRAFGPFTDVSLDLSAGNAGLHLIYGPNEAGKSSALRAITDLLYGIPLRSTDHFLHETKRLRIGGRLRWADGSEVAVVRRKGRENTLLDEQEQPLDEALLTQHLHGIGREHFLSMFGISHGSLVEGGREIVDGKGELGQTLFAAGAGVRRVRAVLTSLEEEASKLYVSRGKEQPINAGLRRYDAAKSALTEAAVPGRRWQEEESALRDAQGQRDAVLAELHRLRRDVSRLSRYNVMLPRLALRDDRLRQLQELGEVVLLPTTAADARKDAQRAQRTAEETLSAAMRDRDALEEALDALDIPEAMLAQDIAIAALHQRLAVILKANSDRSGLVGEYKQLLANVDHLLADLPQQVTREQVPALLLSAAARTRIHQLAQQYPVLTQTVLTAKKSLRQWEDESRDAVRQLEALPPQRDLVVLRQHVERIRAWGDVEQTLAVQQAKLQALGEEIDLAVQRLALWSGTREALLVAAFPLDVTIDQFANRYQTQQQREEQLAGRRRDGEKELAELVRKLDELQRDGAVPTDEELHRIREERDAGWRLVRRAWLDGEDISADAGEYDSDYPLSEAFPRRVSAADELADRLRQEAKRVASHAQLLVQQARCRETLAELQRETEVLAEDRQRLQNDWLACWTPLGITPLLPVEMRAWLGVLRDILRKAESAHELRQTVDGLAGQLDEGKQTLVAAAGEADLRIGELTDRLTALLARAAEAITVDSERERERERLRREIATLARKIATAREEIVVAEQKVVDWQQEWTAAITDLQLPAGALPDEVVATLNVLEDIRTRLHDAEDKAKRIGGIERDAEEFTIAVTEMLTRVAPDLLTVPVDQATGDLHKRLEKAKRDADQRLLLQQQMDAKRQLIATADAEIRRQMVELADLCRQAGCAAPDVLPEAEQRSTQARALQQEIAGLERQIIEQGEGETLAEIIAYAASLDGDALAGQLTDLERTIAGLDAQRSELEQQIGARREAMRRMNGGEAAALAANDLQGVVAEIRDHADQYLRLKLAAALLRRQVEAYRKGNQTPVLQRAGEMFAALTLGSFTGIETDYDDKDRPVLVGMRDAGERIYVEGMSEGTCDQLYLALRLAGLERHLAGSEPLPFIVDDILIAFDDARTAATLNLLAEVSAKTQVILFTHHARVLELAQQSAHAESMHVHDLRAMAVV